MYAHEHRLLALGVSLFLLGAGGGAAIAQVPVKPSQPAPDGQLRSQLSLQGRTATVVYAPALMADDPAHRALLSNASGSTDRVRFGRLETMGPLRIDTLEVGKPTGKPDPAGMRYDLWLEGASDGWQLQVTDVAKDPAQQSPTVVGRVPLPRKPAAAASPALVAALVPETGTAARLVLRWGAYEAATDVQVPYIPLPPGLGNSPPNVTVNRAHDEDLSPLLNVLALTQRSETALVVANGRRFSVSFQRTFAVGERAANAAGGLTSRGLPTDGRDFPRLLTTSVGSVVELTAGSVPRLRIDAPLRFGKTTIATGNQVPGVEIGRAHV